MYHANFKRSPKELNEKPTYQMLKKLPSNAQDEVRLCKCGAGKRSKIVSAHKLLYT